MNLVSPTEFSWMCGSVGLKKIKIDTIPLKNGKVFVAVFHRKDPEQDVRADKDRQRR